MSRAPLAATAALVCLASACPAPADAPITTTPSSRPSPPDTAAEVPQLPPVQQLIRASTALRGIRPSLDELAAVEADPAQLAVLVDAYLDDPRLGEVVRDLHDETLFMSDPTQRYPATGPLAGLEATRIRASLEASPLRLAEHVVVEDLPYSELVTADYTVADPIVAAAWTGLDGYDPAGPEWQVVRWSDGRPAAGLLSDSGLWSRTRSPNRNFNRRRANYVTRTLLCLDYLDLDVDLAASDALADPEDPSVLQSNGVCAACHTSLDPLASFLPFRESWGTADMQWPMQLFTEHGDYWEGLSGQPPAYFGTPGDDLADLGRSIAADPRFSACTARRFYSYLAEVPLDEVPADIVDELDEQFVAAGLSAKALLRDVALHPSLQRAEPLPSRPEQLAATIEDLTGYRWEAYVDEPCCAAPALSSPLGEVDLLRDDLVGYHALAGGIDAYAKLEPTRTATATGALVLRRLAGDAAAFVVAADLQGGTPRLLDRVGPDDTGEDAVRDQLVALRWRLYGERATPADVDPGFALWSATWQRTGSVQEAWTATVAAMLQDFGMAYH
ncbi:MAG: hypothetical protein R3F59_34150 [Myxococcota bacterium]